MKFLFKYVVTVIKKNLLLCLLKQLIRKWKGRREEWKGEAEREFERGFRKGRERERGEGTSRIFLLANFY